MIPEVGFTTVLKRTMATKEVKNGDTIPSAAVSETPASAPVALPPSQPNPTVANAVAPPTTGAPAAAATTTNATVFLVHPATTTAPSTATDTAPVKTDSDGHNAGSESEDEGVSEILEESPCGRWQKRDERVPGLNLNESDVSYVAMDAEEGVEVVWNETYFTSLKKLNEQKDKIQKVYDHLIALEHANIGRFHDYWIDNNKEKPRVVFITEYMSSGTMKQFLRKTKSNKTWKRCCSQILSALSYLRSCNPPIIHGNLNCDNIFIQHDGLVKIGPVAPDAIQLQYMPGKHVVVSSMSSRTEKKNLHYVAPEYGKAQPLTTASDIYSFGICALIMASPELLQGGEENKLGQPANLQAHLNKLTNPLLVDLIQNCVREEPAARSDAIRLLFHPVFFEGQSLKLYAAHMVVRMNMETALPNHPVLKNIKGPVKAETIKGGQSFVIQGKASWKSDVEQYLDDVKIGAHPLSFFVKTTKGKPTPQNQQSISTSTRSQTPEDNFIAKPNGGEDNTNGTVAPEPVTFEAETREVQQMSCSILPREDAEAHGGGGGGGSSEDSNEPTWNLTLLLRMADKMNRQLTCDIDIEEDTADCLVDELVYYGFVSKSDRDKIAQFLDQSFQRLKHQQQQMPSSPSSSFAAIASGDRLQAAVDVDGWIEDGDSATPVRERSQETEDSQEKQQHLQQPDYEAPISAGGDAAVAVDKPEVVATKVEVTSANTEPIKVGDVGSSSAKAVPVLNGDSLIATGMVVTE